MNNAADESQNRPAEQSKPDKKRLVITREDVEKEPPQEPARREPSAAPRGYAPGAVSPPGAAAAETPAGFWLRALAKALDLLFVCVPVAVLCGVATLVAFGLYGFTWAAVASGPDSARASTPASVDWIVWLTGIAGIVIWYLLSYMFYTILAHSADGRSVGKCIVGLKVTIPEGPRSRLFYFFTRFTMAVLGLMPLAAGHLVAAFRRDKRTLHDLVVGSRVVRERRSS